MKTICISLFILLASIVCLAQDTTITDNHHKTLAKLATCNNQTIALSNRLVAHHQQAQTWEGVDADHPDAVALRDKIAQEETEYSNKLSECGAMFEPITKWIKNRHA